MGLAAVSEGVGGQPERWEAGKRDRPASLLKSGHRTIPCSLKVGLSKRNCGAIL